MTTTTPNNSAMLAFRGLATIAIGLWIELFMRVLPLIRKFSGSTDDASKDLFVDMIINEQFYAAAGLVTLAGCGMLIPVVLQTRTRLLSILLWSALGLGVVHLAGKGWLIACLYDFRAALAEPDQAIVEFQENVPDWSGILNGSSALAGYLSAICLLVLAHRLLPLPWRNLPPSTLRSSLVLPIVLAAAAAITLFLATPIADWLLDSVPKTEGAGKTAIGVVIALTVISSFGRLLWLFSFGKVMWACSKEMKARNEGVGVED